MAERALECDLGLEASDLELELLSFDTLGVFLTGVLALPSFKFDFLFTLVVLCSPGGAIRPVRDFDRINFGRTELSFEKLLPAFCREARSILKFAGD